MRAATALILCLVLTFGCAVSANAQSAQEQLEALQSQNDKMEQEISGLRGQLSDNLSEIEEMTAQKNLLDQEIFLLNQQITNMNDQLSLYNTLIADKQTQLEEAQARLDTVRQQNKTRIRAMEKNGKIRYWSVLFKADSFIDLLDRLRMIQKLAEADRVRFAEMNLAAQEVAGAKEALETERQQLQDTRDSLRTTQAELEDKFQEASSLLSGLVAKGEKYEALLEKSEQKQEQLAEKIAQAEKEYSRQNKPQTEPSQSPSSGSSSGNSSGSSTGNSSSSGAVTWLIPMNYTAMTSPFGNRFHPLTGEYKLHKGVDLAAPQGTPIYATRSGTVTTAAYEAGGAGYYVSINHGDGYASIYMHMTHYIVYAGQSVKAGQVIGYCGSTGGSTGPHLHFGISKNGTYVNPANYIDI